MRYIEIPRTWFFIICATLLALVISLCLLAGIAQADELEHLFTCYPQEIQRDFAKIGFKLDLSGTMRSMDAWGFIQNKGSSYSIFTYKSVTDEELQKIQDYYTGE